MALHGKNGFEVVKINIRALPIIFRRWRPWVPWSAMKERPRRYHRAKGVCSVHVRMCRCVTYLTCTRLIEWVPSLALNTILQAVHLHLSQYVDETNTLKQLRSYIYQSRIIEKILSVILGDLEWPLRELLINSNTMVVTISLSIMILKFLRITT